MSIFRACARSTVVLALIGVALLTAPRYSHAQAASTPKAGQYQIDGGSYRMSVEVDGDDVVVVEPNKRSVYRRQGDGSFQFRNPTNGILYGLRAGGDGALEAFKPEQPTAAPTRLVLVAEAGPTQDIDDRWMTLAEQYREKSTSDSANAQAWTACAAVAMQRAVSSKQVADNYARQMAQMLQQLDSRQSPCPDAIPSSMY